jgi:hypothetical protein
MCHTRGLRAPQHGVTVGVERAIAEVAVGID